MNTTQNHRLFFPYTIFHIWICLNFILKSSNRFLNIVLNCFNPLDYNVFKDALSLIIVQILASIVIIHFVIVIIIIFKLVPGLHCFVNIAGSDAGAEEVAAARVVLATYSLLSSHGRRQQELSRGRHCHFGRNDNRCYVSKITV